MFSSALDGFLVPGHLAGPSLPVETRTPTHRLRRGRPAPQDPAVAWLKSQGSAHLSQAACFTGHMPRPDYKEPLPFQYHKSFGFLEQMFELVTVNDKLGF